MSEMMGQGVKHPRKIDDGSGVPFGVQETWESVGGEGLHEVHAPMTSFV